MSHRRSLVAAVVVASLVAACGSTDGEGSDTVPPATPAPTLAGVGAIPAMPSAVREPVVVVRPPVNADGTDAELVGEAVDGNRILMIGDSILASTSSRYGNQMCDAVVPLGWQVAVEAEPSRFVDFGNRVLDRLLPDDAGSDDDWDAALVFLGSNYGGDPFVYAIELAEILDQLAPRPVLLLTVTEYRPNYVDVNEVVRRVGEERDNVTVLDWKTISETPGVLSNDRLHPTETGRRVLAESVAAALGPVDGVGECLRSTFRDDSAVGGNRTAVLGQPSSGSSSFGSGSATTTTVREPTSVTTTTSATGSGGGDVSTTPPTTESSTPSTPSTTVSSTPSTTVSSTPSSTVSSTPSSTVSTSPPATTAPASTSPPATTAPASTSPPGTTSPPATEAPSGGGEGVGGADPPPDQAAATP